MTRDRESEEKYSKGNSVVYERLKTRFKDYFRCLTDDRWFQVNEHSARNVFPGASLAEKRVEGIVSSADSLVARHLAIRLNSMLQAIQLPTGVANLNSGLTNVYRNTFTLKVKMEGSICDTLLFVTILEPCYLQAR